MERKLKDLRVAILVADGFEQVEMTEPKKALDQAGAKTTIISPAKGKVKGWNHKEWGNEFTVDKELNQAKADDYDALLLPGGVMNPDTLRMDPAAVNFVKAFVEAEKPIAAICHGPWTLINAEAVEGRTLTSWPSIKTDLINAGANWVDKQVVKDELLVTSRKPDDIPAFNTAMLEVFSQAQKVGQKH
ncbi:type 1 glutamine amidotransferase domain-containing protein [Candidatus Protochlamydia phocaeensis]|uniref:type 1 glutamine amidotransferase domain-containing protein n=1 Tax=Candidatus Protochlamydia phocaeensis TaxID=1414722 RepID=UPI000838154C|nr:type 1 glutamine amidotransferase domain-containing protein [Candidatus Protochlamydia phocaeensis]